MSLKKEIPIEEVMRTTTRSNRDRLVDKFNQIKAMSPKKSYQSTNFGVKASK